MEHKLITLDEMHLVESIVNQNPNWPVAGIPAGKAMSPAGITKLLDLYSAKLEAGDIKISVAISDTGEPEALYTGVILPHIGAWIIHGPRIAKPSVVYSTSAKKYAPTLDLILEYMQQRMYFKFWNIDVDGRHLRRKMIMDNYSKFSSWYVTYDEMHVPGNFTTGISIYDNIGKGQIDQSDRMIRMYILQQEYRIPYIEEYYKNNK